MNPTPATSKARPSLGSMPSRNRSDPPIVEKGHTPSSASEVSALRLHPRLQGPDKLVTILLEEAKELLAMDRYERRALSRRKFAVRAFDEARRRGSSDY
jgi:hypothetical protein